MPTLISHHKEQVLKNQAKKAYAVLNVAYQKTLYDYGLSSFNNTDYSADENTKLAKAFISNLNVAQKYEDVPLLEKGIIPDYTPLSTAMQNPDESSYNEFSQRYGKEDEDFDFSAFLSKNYGRCDLISQWKHAYFLNDGTLIIFYPYAGYISPSTFIIDTNGKKGPNRWGYDLFVVAANIKRPTLSIYNFTEKGGIGVKSIFGLK